MENSPQLFFALLLVIVFLLVWLLRRRELKRRYEYFAWHKRVVEESVEHSRQSLEELKSIRNHLEKSSK